MKTATTALALCVFLVVTAAALRAQTDGNRDALVRFMPHLSGDGAVIEGPLSVKEIEKKSMEKIAKCERCPQVPFGFINDRWNGLTSKMKEGDAIYYFRTNTGSWMALMGREGYALMREGTVIDMIFTEIN